MNTNNRKRPLPLWIAIVCGLTVGAWTGAMVPVRADTTPPSYQEQPETADGSVQPSEAGDPNALAADILDLLVEELSNEEVSVEESQSVQDQVSDFLNTFTSDGTSNF